MAIDDVAGRKAVREKRNPVAAGESVFVTMPRHSMRIPSARLALRDEVHHRGLDAARKALRAFNAAKAAKP